MNSKVTFHVLQSLIAKCNNISACLSKFATTNGKIEKKKEPWITMQNRKIYDDDNVTSYFVLIN